MKIVPPKLGHGQGNLVTSLMCLDFSEPVTKHSGPFLPHWHQVSKLQFVTFRLADSLPATKLEELADLKNGIHNNDFLINPEHKDIILDKIDTWLAMRHGSCILKYQSIQELIDTTINFYDGLRYDLYDYVIMPNHVHLIILPYEPFEKIFSDFVRFTTKKIHNILNIRGRIWQRDVFDRIIRSLSDFSEKVEYIKANPGVFPEE